MFIEELTCRLMLAILKAADTLMLGFLMDVETA